MNDKEIRDAYLEGLSAKCAEYGVDAEQLVKLAQELVDPELSRQAAAMDKEYKPKPRPAPPPLKPYKKEVLKDLPADSGARAGRYDALKDHAQKEIDAYAALRAKKSGAANPTGVLEKLFATIGRGAAAPVARGAELMGGKGGGEYAEGLRKTLAANLGDRAAMRASGQLDNPALAELANPEKLQNLGKLTAGTAGAGGLAYGAGSLMSGSAPQEPPHGYPYGY